MKIIAIVQSSKELPQVQMKEISEEEIGVIKPLQTVHVGSPMDKILRELFNRGEGEILNRLLNEVYSIGYYTAKYEPIE